MRGIVGRAPNATIGEVTERLVALGLKADHADIKKELSKAKREAARWRAGKSRPAGAASGTAQ